MHSKESVEPFLLGLEDGMSTAQAADMEDSPFAVSERPY